MNDSGSSVVSSSDRIVEIQEIVRRSNKVHVHGSQTKTGFHRLIDGATPISTQSLSGVVSYDPQEFVVTLLSGTKVSDVIELLGKERQYLPFDPLLAERGATIGGTVASNAAGAGRFRFGGIRDFILGVRFIDGRGNAIRGGGQVVKNAAGFDYPKLMVGSHGALGLIYELTFKVFPRPETYATIIGSFANVEDAVSCMNELAASPMDVEAIDLIPVQTGVGGYELAVRIGGIETSIAKRLSRLQTFVTQPTVLQGQDELAFWRAAANFQWADPMCSIGKLPITPNAIPGIDEQLTKARIDRRYSVGGNVAWIAGDWTTEWSNRFGQAQAFLCPQTEANPTLPKEPGPFGKAIKNALDPTLKFV